MLCAHTTVRASGARSYWIAGGERIEGEVPRRSTQRLPRFIDEFVMAQVEAPANLARLHLQVPPPGPRQLVFLPLPPPTLRPPPPDQPFFFQPMQRVDGFIQHTVRGLIFELPATTVCATFAMSLAIRSAPFRPIQTASSMSHTIGSGAEARRW